MIDRFSHFNSILRFHSPSTFLKTWSNIIANSIAMRSLLNLNLKWPTSPAVSFQQIFSYTTRSGFATRLYNVIVTENRFQEVKDSLSDNTPTVTNTKSVLIRIKNSRLQRPGGIPRRRQLIICVKTSKQILRFFFSLFCAETNQIWIYSCAQWRK